MENKQIKLTLNDLLYIGNEYETIRYVEEHRDERLSTFKIDRPRKPIIKDSPTSDEAKVYYESLVQYEKDLVEFNKEKEIKASIRDEYNSLIIDYIKEVSGLNNIPEQYRGKVYEKAYQNGHSSGYYEVYNSLCSLIEIFE